MGIMLSSTRDIAPSCVENVDELIERGKKILEHPDKPKFLEGNVKRIQEGWDDTKKKAQDRLKLLQDTKEAWVGYAENNETIASVFEAVEAKLEVVTRFKDTVAVVEEFCTALVNFDNSLKAVDGWKDAATAELKDIKEASGAMLPEDRVARTMD